MPKLCLGRGLFAMNKVLVASVCIACLVVSGSAFGQTRDPFGVDARNDSMLFLGLGGYFPTVTHTANSYRPGLQVIGGIRFAVQGADVVVSAHGKTYFSGDDTSAGRVQIGLLSVDAYARSSRLYAGPGIGMASSNASFTFNSDGYQDDNFGRAIWQTVWSLTAGVDITPNTFFEARLQNSRAAGYQGYSLSAGVRF